MMTSRPLATIRAMTTALALLAGASLIAGPISAQTTPQSGAAAPLTPVNENGQMVVTLEHHVFTPAEIHVPAGKRTQILLKNLDPTAEEFDSPALKVEKVVAGKSEGIVRLRELDPGSYPFTGEYNAATAKGVVIAQ